jgi:uncharacterized SAM-binding protein YcdF (DUF218 family)
MNELFLALGIETWKPMVGALLLPPAPLLLLILLGAVWLPRRRGLGWTAVLLGVVGLWATSTTAVGFALVQSLSQPPAALTATQISRLARAPRTAIVVLGGGIRRLAPEYAGPDLQPMTAERLRYGVWLARQTGLPVLFSGGVSLGRDGGPTEADTASRVAQRDFALHLRWIETESRDTNENALFSLRLLHREGIEHIVLVTHGYHQRRAIGAFERAIRRDGVSMDVVPATMGWGAPGPLTAAHFMPSREGFDTTWLALHEWLGRLGGA